MENKKKTRLNSTLKGYAPGDILGVGVAKPTRMADLLTTGAGVIGFIVGIVFMGCLCHIPALLRYFF